MDFIWDYPEGILSSKIYAHFTKPRGTSSAILHKIAQKGYVSLTQIGREHLYTPKISRLEYKRRLMFDMLGSHFGINTLDQFFASFCGQNSITKEQQQKLLALIEEMESNEI